MYTYCIYIHIILYIYIYGLVVVGTLAPCKLVLTCTDIIRSVDLACGGMECWDV